MKPFVKLLTFILIFIFIDLQEISAQFVADAGPDQTICLGDSVKLGGNPTGPSGALYQWDNSTTLDTATLSNPMAFPTMTTLYTVTATDINGRSATDQVTVTVVLPDTVNAGKDTTICSGDSVRLGSNPTAPAGSSFEWNNGSTLDNDTVANPKAFPTASTTYVVTMTDPNGCTNTDTITVSLLEATVNQNDSSLTSDVIGDAYQWIDCNGGDTAISGATEQSYKPSINGSYAVIVTVGNCLDTSDCVSFLTIGIEKKLANAALMQVYPNPSNGYLTLELNNSTISNTMLSLYSIEGRLVYQKQIQKRMNLLNLNELDNGVYFLHYQDQIEKIVIHKVQ